MEHDHQHLLLLIRPLLSFKTLFNIANDLHGQLHDNIAANSEKDKSLFREREAS